MTKLESVEDVWEQFFDYALKGEPEEVQDNSYEQGLQDWENRDQYGVMW